MTPLSSVERSDEPGRLTLPFRQVPGIELYPAHLTVLGVTLPRASQPGANTPEADQFKRHVITKYDLVMMRDLAIALKLGQAILLEGGTNIGKTTGIERIAHLTNQNYYYINCHKMDPSTIFGGIRPLDPRLGMGEAGFVPGPLTKAIESGGIGFLDEFNFMQGKTRGRLHEVTDAVLDGKKYVSLSEDGGRMIEVHRDFRLVCAQNKPGGSYGDREVLDPAQFTRFVYHAMPDELSDATRMARKLGRFGRDNEFEITADMLRKGVGISEQELAKMSELEQLLIQYDRFTKQIGTLLNEGKIGAACSQPIFLADQRDFDRFITYITHLYDGDLGQTARQALDYYWTSRFREDRDRIVVQTLIDLVGHQPTNDANRIGISTTDLDALISDGASGPNTVDAILRERVRTALDGQMRSENTSIALLEVLQDVYALKSNAAIVGRLLEITQRLKGASVLDVASDLTMEVEAHDQSGEGHLASFKREVIRLLRPGQNPVDSEQCQKLIGDFKRSQIEEQASSSGRKNLMLIAMSLDGSTGGTPIQQLISQVAALENPKPQSPPVVSGLSPHAGLTERYVGRVDQGKTTIFSEEPAQPTSEAKN